MFFGGNDISSASLRVSLIVVKFDWSYKDINKLGTVMLVCVRSFHLSFSHIALIINPHRLWEHWLNYSNDQQ